jgi:hypothetical protein
LELSEVKMGNEFQALLAGVTDMARLGPRLNAILRRKDMHLVWSFSKYFSEFLFRMVRPAGGHPAP